jgi:hypothetical protein
MRLILRRQLKPPLLPVDNDAPGYTVPFKRVRIGCAFKTELEWYIKMDEEGAVLNGTFTRHTFDARHVVWVTSLDHVKPIASGKLTNI